MHTTIRTITAAAVTAALAFGATPAIAQDASNDIHALADSDGDGLPDEWETRGVVLTDGTEIPLPDWGADPHRPDIFLQLNWMAPHNGKSFAPTPEILDDLVQLFDDNGINLFIDAGETYTNIANYTDTFGGETLDYSPYYFDSEHSATKLMQARNALGERKNVFHLGVIGDQTRPGSYNSGEAIIGAGSFFVANNARMTTQEELRNTILHEFGHNLGLRHNGPADHVADLKVATHDPAYHSVMNYRYQVGDNAIFDYSHTGYTYNHNGLTHNVPADWDNLQLADPALGQNYKTFGPGQTRPVALEGAKAQRKANVAARAAQAQAQAAQVETPAQAQAQAQAPVKATTITVNEIKAEAVKAQTPAQAAQQIATQAEGQAGGPNIAAIIGAIVALLALLGIGAGAAFMM